MMDKPLSFYAFEMLYWCGIREGELLALTPADFDFEKGTVSISKSYQRLSGQDLITTPKTEKSNRVITMPRFLVEEIQDYLKMLYGIGPDDRMFTITKSYLHREMDRGAKEAGVPRIRIHDIRHSAVSLLIDMGFSATAIADLSLIHISSGSSAAADAIAMNSLRVTDLSLIHICPSGTEALVRVMVEGKDSEQVNTLAKRVAKVVESVV